jgi:hypothetical protein
MTVETLDTAPMALEHEDARDSRRLGFSLTLPAQLLVLFIAVFPILMQVYISLTDWSPLDGIGWWQAHQLWNNFANYTDLAADDRFLVGAWAHRPGNGDLRSGRISPGARAGDPVRRQFPRPAPALLCSAGAHDGGSGSGRLHVLHAFPVGRTGE